MSQLKKFEVPKGNITSASSTGVGTQKESLGFIVDGKIAATEKKNVLKNWVTSTGTIKADTGYLVTTEEGKEKDKWHKELQLEKNKIYSNYSFYTKNINTKKVVGFSISRVIIDYKTPITEIYSNMPLIRKNTDKKDTYNTFTKKNIEIYIEADYGLSGKSKVEYQLLKKGEKFKKNSGWKLLKGDTLKVTKDFNGVAYFRFTDNTGNFTVDKTFGFARDKKKPSLVQTKANVKSIALTDTTKVKKIKYGTSTSRSVIIDVKANYGSGRKKVEYKLVPEKKLFSKTKWSTLKGTKLNINKNFKGVVYIKLTDKAGNTRTYRTDGFQIKK